MYNVYCNCCFYMQSEHSLINTLHQMNYNSFVEAIILEEMEILSPTTLLLPDKKVVGGRKSLVTGMGLYLLYT